MSLNDNQAGLSEPLRFEKFYINSPLRWSNYESNHLPATEWPSTLHENLIFVCCTKCSLKKNNVISGAFAGAV